MVRARLRAWGKSISILSGKIAFCIFKAHNVVVPLSDKDFSYRVAKRNATRKKEGKLNTSQAESVAASRAAVGQFLSISREAFILRTR